VCPRQAHKQASGSGALPIKRRLRRLRAPRAYQIGDCSLTTDPVLR
jgi:hypothetical protein